MKLVESRPLPPDLQSEIRRVNIEALHALQTQRNRLADDGVRSSIVRVPTNYDPEAGGHFGGLELKFGYQMPTPEEATENKEWMRYLATLANSRLTSDGWEVTGKLGGGAQYAFHGNPPPASRTYDYFGYMCRMYPEYGELHVEIPDIDPHEPRTTIPARDFTEEAYLAVMRDKGPNVHATAELFPREFSWKGRPNLVSRRVKEPWPAEVRPDGLVVVTQPTQLVAHA